MSGGAGAGPPDQGPLAIICGAGTLPFAVADAVQAGGRNVVLFALRGWADPQRVPAYRHHWGALGQFGWVCRQARAEGCRDIVFIGTISRPPLWRLRFDWGTLRIVPRMAAAYRGGDNHLLSGVAQAFEQQGFRLVGAHEVAPEILMPAGMLSKRQPNAQERSDVAQALRLLEAIGKFDVGQAAVVADNHVLAVEGAEGTDKMLERVAELRGRRIGAPGGVLVKAPKPGQDWRFDLPSIGPQTVEGVARAGLAGVAVLARASIVAEPQRVTALADAHNIFVAGANADGTLG
jgi:UDP-2,3-diacylglucosamine hydrolase